MTIDGQNVRRAFDGLCKECPYYQPPQNEGEKYGRCQVIRDIVNGEWLCAEFIPEVSENDTQTG